MPGWGATRYERDVGMTCSIITGRPCVMAWIWLQVNTDVSMLCPTLLHLFLNAGVGDDAARVRLVLQALRALPAATMR